MPDILLEVLLSISHYVGWANEIIFPKVIKNLEEKKVEKLSIPHRFYGSKLKRPYSGHGMDSMKSITPGSRQEGERDLSGQKHRGGKGLGILRAE